VHGIEGAVDQLCGLLRSHGAKERRCSVCKGWRQVWL
jgi:hypothetical protein